MYNPLKRTTDKLDKQIAKTDNNWIVYGIIGAIAISPFVITAGKDWIHTRSNKKKVQDEAKAKEKAKKSVLDHEHKLKEEERENELKRDIMREKVKTEEFLKRKAASQNNACCKDTCSDYSDIEPAHITTLDELDKVETKLEPLAGLLIPENVGGVMVYGPKGSLKSHIVLKLLCQMNTGEPIKILPDYDPYYGKTSDKKPFCFYVDAENGPAEVKKRISTYFPRMDKNRFYAICTKSFGSDNMTSVLSAIEKKIDDIPTGSIIPAVFDNLNSLLENASNQAEAKELLNGIKHIQKIANNKHSTFIPIIVHHENCEGKAFGSSVLKALTPNIIHIIETDNFDIKKVVYEHHRYCSAYNPNAPFYLDVHHSGPADDEDIEIKYRGTDDDGGEKAKKMEVLNINQNQKNEKFCWNSPEGKAKVESTFNELINEAMNKGEKITQGTASLNKIAKRLGTTTPTLSKYYKSFVEDLFDSLSQKTEIVA